MKKKSGTSLYWTCQAIGWSLYVLAVAAPNLTKGTTPIEMLLYSTCLGVLAIAQTHALRSYARKHAWDRLEIRRIVPRALASSAAMGTVLNVFMVLCDVYYFKFFGWSQIRLKWHFFVY